MRTLCNHIILNTQQWKNIRSSNYWTLFMENVLGIRPHASKVR